MKKNIIKKNNRNSSVENHKSKISRKKFFGRIGLASLIPLGGAWYSTSRRTQLREKQIKKITLPANLPAGISFYDNVIVSKEKGKINILSAKCTHLGCIINKEENNVLVCPCHGSRYAMDGMPVKGPAASPLKKLPFKINTQTGEITVDIKV